MGALTGKRRGDDYYYKSLASNSVSPPIDRSYGHVLKKPRFSSTSQSTVEYNLPVLSNSASRILQYPDTKQGFRRQVHAPVRNPRFGSFGSWNLEGSCGSSKEGSADQMDRCSRFLQAKLEYARDLAFETFRYVCKGEESVGKQKEKEKEVIEVDGEEENRVDVSDDSSVEEVEILGSRSKGQAEDLDVKMAEKEVRSLDSSVVTDASNADAKVDVAKKMGLPVLVGESDDSKVPFYKRLLNSSSKTRDDKLKQLKFNIEMNEKHSWWYQLLRPRKKEEPIKKDVAEECFLPLSEDEEREVSRALSNANRRKVLVSHQNSNIDITGEILQCLNPGAWLNDEVINLYLELLKEREKREPQKFLKCHFFNTFFYKKLIAGRGGYNFQSVRRWTTQRKLGYGLLECDKIFVPIHKEIHWCLAIINKKEEKFQYLDSLGGVDTQVLKVLARYFVDEVKDKCGKDVDVSSWEIEFVTDLPEQKNGFDCGMFMIKYSDFYSRDIGLCFSQKHMPYFRRRTAKEILKLRAD